jgi:hypothetical protein
MSDAQYLMVDVGLNISARFLFVPPYAANPTFQGEGNTHAN